MPQRIISHPQAERDLEECIVYIGEEDIEAAQSFYLAFVTSLDHIAQFPLSGSPREFSNPQFHGIRMWIVKGFENYLIFYRVTEKAVEVIRVLHSARDLEELFS